MDRRIVVKVTEDANVKEIKKRIKASFNGDKTLVSISEVPLGRPRNTKPIGGPPLSVRIPLEDDAGLVKIMARDKQEKAAVIRRAVRELLDREGECTNKQPEKGEKILEMG